METKKISMQQLRKTWRRPKAQGNALMEYAVPACIILFSAGVLLTVTDATTIMAEYFMTASGHTKSSLSGTTFKTEGLATLSYGSVGNGLDGFTSFATVKDGSGAATGESAGGVFYSGSVTRTGARPVSPSTEYLFP
jgi:hypothetical protein